MTRNLPTDYESAEKEMNRLYSEDGIFSYTAEGFISKKNQNLSNTLNIQIFWKLILSPFVFCIEKLIPALN
jgi:hypothetical protein